MKSRVSCCNGGLIRRDLGKSALLWIGYLLLWLVAMPANLFASADWIDAMDMREHVLDLAADTCHLVSALYGLVVAWFLFSYLHKARSANFFGALPLRRETQFLSHYISGLLYSLIPNLALYGATVVAGAALEVNLVVETAVWFAAHSLTFLFYYSLAVLCSVVVGNVIAMPVLYGILNFVAVVVEAICYSLMESLLYGISLGHEMRFGWLSPLYHFPLDSNLPKCTRIYENDKLVDFLFKGWEGLLILGAVGILLAVIAFFIHRGRHMEAAGDVVAVKRLRPVFLYVFTFGFTMVVGMLMAEMLVRDMDSSSFLPISACLLVSAVVGHFLGHMILQRSLRVFHRKNLITCGISLAVLVVVLGAMKLDVCGVVRYVPQHEDVAAVRLNSSRHDVDDPQRIAEVIELHEEILARKSETEALCRESSYKPMVDIVYILESGREVCREYRLPITDENFDDPNSLIRKYEVVNNTPEMILAREIPTTEITWQSVDNCIVYYNVSGEHGYEYTERIEPNSQEAVKLWQEAILLDLQAGNMGQDTYTEHYLPTTEREGVKASFCSEVSVEFQLKTKEGNYDYCYYQIPDTAVHTKAALIEMGVPEEAFAVESISNTGRAEGIIINENSFG